MSPYHAERHGPDRIVGPGFHVRVWALVRTIPAGFVVSYGDVARALGRLGVARHVGWALAALPAGSDVPWWRVVDSRGRLSRLCRPGSERQRDLLAGEGVEADDEGCVVGFTQCRADLQGS